MSRLSPLLVLACVATLVFLLSPTSADDSSSLHLTLRSRVSRAGKDGSVTLVAVEKKADWDPKKTAIIVCDMWDDHWCKSAARRVVELAGPMNDMLSAARGRGVFIIHAPSTCTGFYKDTPQRKRASSAPFVRTPVSLVTTQRWGTCWHWTDGKREGVLPIDDTDMGCDCKVKCEIRDAVEAANRGDQDQ